MGIVAQVTQDGGLFIQGIRPAGAWRVELDHRLVGGLVEGQAQHRVDHAPFQRHNLYAGHRAVKPGL